MTWSGTRHTKGNTWCEIHAYKEKSEEVNSTVSHSNHALPAHGGGLPHSAEVDSPSPPPSCRCCATSHGPTEAELHLPLRGRRARRTAHDVDLCLAQHLRPSAAPKTTLPGPRSRPVLRGPEDVAHVRQRVPTTLSDSDPGRLPPPAPWTQPKTWRASWSLAATRWQPPQVPPRAPAANPTRHVHGWHRYIVSPTAQPAGRANRRPRPYPEVLKPTSTPVTPPPKATPKTAAKTKGLTGVCGGGGGGESATQRPEPARWRGTPGAPVLKLLNPETATRGPSWSACTGPGGSASCPAPARTCSDLAYLFRRSSALLVDKALFRSSRGCVPAHAGLSSRTKTSARKTACAGAQNVLPAHKQQLGCNLQVTLFKLHIIVPVRIQCIS